VPVLIATTYHPNWQGEKSQVIYAATTDVHADLCAPFDTPHVRRRWLDRVGVWLSAFTLVALLGFIVWHHLGQPRIRPDVVSPHQAGGEA